MWNPVETDFSRRRFSRMVLSKMSERSEISKMNESFRGFLNKEQAIKFAENGIWKSWSPEQIAIFQLQQRRLCMPFNVFHKAVEKALGRPVWTHEFAEPHKLLLELKGIRKQPTFEEILASIPKEKLILILDVNSRDEQK